VLQCTLGGKGSRDSGTADAKLRYTRYQEKCMSGQRKKGEAAYVIRMNAITSNNILWLSPQAVSWPTDSIPGRLCGICGGQTGIRDGISPNA